MNKKLRLSRILKPRLNQTELVLNMSFSSKES